MAVATLGRTSQRAAAVYGSLCHLPTWNKVACGVKMSLANWWRVADLQQSCHVRRVNDASPAPLDTPCWRCRLRHHGLHPLLRAIAAATGDDIPTRRPRARLC